MSYFIEYDLENGTTILVETNATTGGVVPAGRGENIIIKSKKKFSEAFKEAKLQAEILIKEIEELHVEEAEIKFGLTTTGEAGNIAIGKIGFDVNYEVTLKWKKPTTKDTVN